MLSGAAAPVVYVLAAIPMFVVARVRYAVTGKFSSFFRIFSNGYLCLRELGPVLLYLFQGALLQAAVLFVLGFLTGIAPVLAGSVVGMVLFLLPPTAWTVYRWMLVDLATPLARSIAAYERKRVAGHRMKVPVTALPGQ